MEMCVRNEMLKWKLREECRQPVRLDMHLVVQKKDVAVQRPQMDNLN